jgi:hypothetical protein
MEVAVRSEYDPAGQTEHPQEDAFATVTFYLGKRGDEGDGPQAWLVEYRPYEGGMIKPHFHKAAQFQVVVAGAGLVGKKRVRAGSVHFADAFTPYGPIIPDTTTEGIDFYTLRAASHPGTYWMPGSRDEMGGRYAGRDVTGEVPDEPMLTQGVELRTLVEPRDDGLAMLLVRLGPGEQSAGPSPAGSGGQYYVVAEGGLRHDDRGLPRDSLIFVGPDEEPPLLTADADGADVLVLQYPIPVAPLPDSALSA